MRGPLLALLLVLVPLAGAAQDAPASLVADAIRFDRSTLVAEGSVEILAGDRILRAERITYLRDEDRLLVEGPLTLVDAGGTLLVADFASLRSDLRDSVLRGARLVLERKLQIAASAVSRDAEGRRTELVQTVASSCEICRNGGVPLWQIRARRIVHDEEDRQLYFESARFEVGGVPVAWLPRMRLPGPGNDRSTGLLAPRFTSDDQLGSGITVPYFIALGPSRDLTVAPFVTDMETRSLGLRYRQAFEAGAVEVNASVAGDQVRPGATRGHLFAEGYFRLPRRYRLAFDIETTTDDAYLEQYDISGADRLASRIALSRVERDDRMLADATLFRTLREGERSDALPSRILSATREHRRDLWGGIAFWQLEAQGRERPLSAVPGGLPPGSARDAVRLSASGGWRGSAVTEWGAVVSAFAEAHLDNHLFAQDPLLDDERVTRVVPYAGVQARLPLVRSDGTVSHVLEPIVQIVLAPDRRDQPPNEDSLTPELDEGNLLATSRFAGRDRRELGERVDLGLSYARRSPGGWSVDAFAGRVLRTNDLDQFTGGTGLAGRSSDWLLSVGVGLDDSVVLLGRSLVDDDGDVARFDSTLRLRGETYALETRYVFLEADVDAGRARGTSELEFDAALDLARDWTGRVNWRYDFEADDPTRAGVGLTYRSDCVEVAFDVERRFTSTTELEPTTRFGLGLELVGFGADDRPRRGGRCGTRG